MLRPLLQGSALGLAVAEIVNHIPSKFWQVAVLIACCLACFVHICYVWWNLRRAFKKQYDKLLLWEAVTKLTPDELAERFDDD